jgi:hypothetical protein
MKKILFLLPLFLALFSVNVFSQTVYINQSGDRYHTKACKYYTKNFQAVSLLDAMGKYGKQPCSRCNPPTKVVKTVPKKKISSKPKPAVKK